MTDPLVPSDDEHHDHPAWAQAQAAIDTIESWEDPPETEQALMRSTCAVLGYLVGLQSCPSPIVTLPYLDRVATHVDSLHSAIRDWMASPSDLSAPVKKDAEALAALARAYPTTKDSFSYGVRSAFELALQAAEKRVGELREQVAQQRAELEAMTAASDQTRSDSQAALEGLRAQVSQATETINAQTTRLDTALTNHQTAFTEAENNRQTQFGDALRSMRDDQAELKKQAEQAVATTSSGLKEQAERTASDLKEQAGEVIDQLSELEGRAQKLVGAIGITGTATDYGLYAKQERHSANIWRYVAVGLFVTAFVLFLAVIWLEHIDGGTPWQAIALKFGGSLALLAGGTYAARESAQHRAEERASKDTELLLNALEPFIATLDEDKDKEAIRKDVAKKVFVEGCRAKGLSPGFADSSTENAAAAAKVAVSR